MDKILVSWRRENNIAFVTIDNPPVNALSTSVFEQLLKAIKELENDNTIKIVVFTSENKKFFSAGADITEFPQWAQKGRSFVEEKSLELNKVFYKISSMNKPTIAVLNGVTLGGGCELALSCDFRIMEEQAVIGLPEVKLGLFPGAGGTQRLPRIVGEARAKEIIFTGKKLSAKEAHNIGLVNEVVMEGRSLEAAEELAQGIAKLSLPALQLIKSTIQDGMETTLIKGLEIEASNFGKVFETEDVQEGLSAFLEKRPANFKDR